MRNSEIELDIADRLYELKQAVDELTKVAHEIRRVQADGKYRAALAIADKAREHAEEMALPPHIPPPVRRRKMTLHR